ncbi:MAG: hypothetical protein QXV61_00195 [Archaeoglobaceae archaeon]
MDVLIDGVKYKAIESVDVSHTVATPEHRVEEGYNIVDHAFFEPIEVQFTLSVTEQELQKLKSLYNSKQTTEVVYKGGVVDNVILKQLDVTQGGSKNMLKATVTFRQILKAKAKTAEIPLEVIKSEDEAKGSNSQQSPSEQNVQQAPQKQENKSWLDSIFDFFGNLFGGK